MLFGGAAAALIVIVVVIALIVKGCSGRTDALAGTWDFDGTTTYEFDGNGTGAMVLPSISYDFTYTIDGNKLVIDYSNESVHDSTYEFTVDGDILTMVGGEGTVSGTYKLTRQEENMVFSKKQKLLTEVYMKTKKVLPLISLLFVAIMLLSVGMIAKEYRERQQDIKGFEKL